MQAEEEPTVEPSEEVWQRISAATAGRLGSRRPSATEWLPRLAAALLVGFGLWAVAGSARLPQPVIDRDAALELVIGEDRGQMTESRFLELATELLKAALPRKAWDEVAYRIGVSTSMYSWKGKKK